MLSGISETPAFPVSTFDKVETQESKKFGELIAEIVASIFIRIIAVYVICVTAVILLLAGLYAYSPVACFFVSGAIAARMIFLHVMDQE